MTQASFGQWPPGSGGTTGAAIVTGAVEFTADGTVQTQLGIVTGVVRSGAGQYQVGVSGDVNQMLLSIAIVEGLSAEPRTVSYSISGETISITCWDNADPADPTGGLCVTIFEEPPT